jgi:hypothetical protein
VRDVATFRRRGVPAVAILTAELERLGVDTARAMGIDPSECTVVVSTPLFGLSRAAVARRAALAADGALARLGLAQSSESSTEDSPTV